MFSPIQSRTIRKFINSRNVADRLLSIELSPLLRSFIPINYVCQIFSGKCGAISFNEALWKSSQLIALSHSSHLTGKDKDIRIFGNS